MKSSQRPDSPVSLDAARANEQTDRILAGFGSQAKFVREIFAQDPRPQEDINALKSLKVLVDEMLRTGNQATDPMREVFARLGDKWSALLLILLEMRPMRFSMLNQLVDTISAEGAISRRILTLSLRGLEHDGFVARDDRSGKRLYVSYALTPLGRDFVGAFRQLLVWTRAHLGQIRRAREDYSQRYERRIPAVLNGQSSATVARTAKRISELQ